MFKIQTLNKISSIGLDLFDRDKYEVATEIPEPDGIVLRSFKMHDMELGASLKAVARAGAGVNNIPIDKCSEQGIVVFNTPGANANGVKELVLAGMLLASRDIIGGVNWSQTLTDKGDEVPGLVEKGKKDFAGGEIAGKTLGVIGLGAIGVMVANDAIALGMNVVGYDPFMSVEAAWGASSDIERASGIEDLISKADFLSIHVPLNDKTKGLLNEEKFGLMKKGVSLLNFSRGGLVDNAALKDAIKNEIVSCYVTDFPDADLLGVDGVIPIPHLGASTEEAEDNCAGMAVKQIIDYLETGNIKNSVNFPDVNLPLAGNRRLLVANNNVPNMIGQITAILADAGANIIDMVNSSKGDLAYNAIDLDGEVDDKLVEAVKAIDGVITARIITIK
ncbi:MAG: phosphoglycerate dehydrogenase [Planctomycetota bacterium]